MDRYPLWINGHEIDTGETFTVSCPYDGSPVASVSLASTDHVQQAVAAATQARSVMRDLTRADRSGILRRAQALLQERRDVFARTIALESGKPIREARSEVQRGTQTLQAAAEEANRLTGEVIPLDASPTGKGHWAMTIREPIGVIAAVTPFNFPLNLSLHKLAPAIASGNTVVHKPATTTPITALLLARLFHDAGLPPGALNVIAGPGATVGDPLVMHPDIAMITFTGSPPVGMAIRAKAGFKRVTLELGNNSAVLIDHDADVADVAARCTIGAFSNSGQVCISVQRIFVAADRHDDMVDALAARAAKLTTGAPLESATEISSLISPAEAERVDQWIDEAVRDGARPIVRGPRDAARLAPTVLANAPLHGRLNQEEAFGPVVFVNAYDDFDAAIDIINATPYGLQAGVFTKDLDRAFHAAKRLHMGGVMINEVPQYRVDLMPYGGVKQSGIGREGPRYAMEEMTELKLISWRV